MNKKAKKKKLSKKAKNLNIINTLHQVCFFFVFKLDKFELVDYILKYLRFNYKIGL